MIFSNGFFLDIQRIRIAHKFLLDRGQKFEYPSGRGYYGLVYVLGGRAEYRFFTGERVTITEGDVLFLAPDAAYSIVPEKAFEHYTVNFSIHAETSRLGSLDKRFVLLHESNTAQLKQIFSHLVGVWSSKKASFEMQSVGSLYELLSLFYLDYTNSNSPAAYQRLLPAKEYVEQYFYQPVSLDDLARLSCMSVTNFRREWKKLYSETPLQYRDTIRLYYAKEYLISGYYTVSEIAQKCGFEDVSYFVRFFKKQTGITPGEYKKQTIGG